MAGEAASLPSAVESLARAAKASGKFGGVTGVFAGVHIAKWQPECAVVPLPFLCEGLIGLDASWKNTLSAVVQIENRSQLVENGTLTGTTRRIT